MPKSKYAGRLPRKPVDPSLITPYCPVCGHKMPNNHGIHIDPERRMVHFLGHTVRLRPNAFTIFRKLYERFPRTVSGPVLTKAIGVQSEIALRVHLHHLRQGLDFLNLRVLTTRDWRQGLSKRPRVTRYSIEYPDAEVMKKMIDARRPRHPMEATLVEKVEHANNG